MISNIGAIQTKTTSFRERKSSTLCRPSSGYPCLDRLKRRRPDAKVIINVGGRRFVTWKNTLKRFPQTLLGSEELAARFYDQDRKEYFIDRDPHLFRYILNYYRCGKLHRSYDDCHASFEDELSFYGIMHKRCTTVALTMTMKMITLTIVKVQYPGRNATKKNI